MGRLICPLFYVHTSPSVHVTEPKLPVGPGSLAACLDIRWGFVEQSKPSPFLLVATTAYLRNGSVALPQIDWGRTGTRPRAQMWQRPFTGGNPLGSLGNPRIPHDLGTLGIPQAWAPSEKFPGALDTELATSNS